MDVKKVTTSDLVAMKRKGEKITMLTAYDCLMASQLDECGIDMIMVGDSVGNVLLGYDNTIPVTMNEMIHHCRAVTRGVSRVSMIWSRYFAVASGRTLMCSSSVFTTVTEIWWGITFPSAPLKS